LLTWLFLSSAAAVTAVETNDNWLVRSWQTDDSLPDNSVAGVAQTPDGYLWVGMPTGLARFDGVRFESFSLTNVIAPPNRGIITMLHGAHGALWLAMDRGGVVYLRGNASRAITQELPNFIPYSLAEDREGGLWISYRNGAVYWIRGNHVTSAAGLPGFPAGSDICELTADAQGHIWFAKAGRIGQFRNGGFQTLANLEAQPVRLAPAQGGGVWLCAGFHLFQCDGQGTLQNFGEFHPQNSGTTVTVLFEDHEGAVWIGTSFSGLFRHDSAGFETVPTSHQGILSLTEDSEANIWVGTFGGGLDRVRRRAITLVGTEEGLPFSSIQSICEDRDGTLWAVTKNGVLVRKSGAKWNSIPVSAQWPGDATCVVSAPQGSLWIGTRLHGLFCWRGGRFVNWGDPGPLVGKTLHTLLVEKNGDLWIGQESPTAVLRLHDGKLDTFAVPPDCRIIRAMAEDAAGNVWVGTSKGVLLRVSGNKINIVSVRHEPELASIRCLCATPDGALWIGFAGWGVGCMKDGHYHEISSEQGLFDDYISHIIADGQGWLWFGANRGIFKVRQSDLEAVAAGSASRVRPVYYGRGVGLPSLQGTFGDSPDVLCSRDGRLWIPMQTALVVVDPSKLHENTEAPPTLLTRVLVDEQAVACYGGILPGNGGQINDLAVPGTKLRVPPGHHRIEFEFAAFSFNAAENVQFRYRLRNYDDVWVDAGNRRVATYSRLPSGRYIFEMTTCNNAGEWNQTGSRLSLVVTPFFWQTWWFRLGALAAFTGGLIAIVRYVSFRRLHQKLRRLEQQAALQKERGRIAKDIHDDLGANLTQIAFLGELAQQDRGEPDKVAERIGQISSTVRQSIKSLDEIVWAVNPRNDTLSHLVDYTGQFAVDYLRLAGIRCRLDFPEQIPVCEFSTDLRHNLFLVIKEALQNVVKHSAATEVWWRLNCAGQTLDVVIEDNGRGFIHAPDDALADGLRNMAQRMAEIGGSCKIEGRPGCGTTVTLHLPLPKMN
jgi:ligand-binding sensor domain-containing protein/signal transduction histidine kinase